MATGSTPPPHLAANVLAALVRNHFSTEPEPIGCAFAAAVFDGERRAILLPAKGADDGVDVTEFGLGSVLIWGHTDPTGIAVVAPTDRARKLARQAEAFDQLSVYTIDGTSLAHAEPAELEPVPELSEAALNQRELFESVGAVAVDDFGRLIAEVDGLEIARADSGNGQLQIGVGTADRELHGYVHTNRDPTESLQSAASTVRDVRQMGAAGHPLNRRARQRWLRASAYATPSLLGAASLEMLAPLTERVLQLGPEPCAAFEPDTDTVFVFSAGIDPEVVPAATDYQRRHNPKRTVIVTSAADAFGPNTKIAASVGIETVAIASPY